jgi:hypothetical protein
MKRLVIYYLAILIPFLLLIWIARAGYPVLFTKLLLIYFLPYRILIDGLRLVNKRILNWNQVWKLLIPGQRILYFKELYFKK